MKRTLIIKVKAAALFAVSFFINSCALSKAIYLGPNDYSARTGPLFSGEPYNAENINGVFPEAVYIKTRTQTFNAYHYYVLYDGRIWYKSINREKEPIDWTLFEKTGLPHNPRRLGFSKTNAIAEISADADELTALSSEGQFYRYCFDKTVAHSSKVWLDRQGWPSEEPLRLDMRTAKNISWALGKRNSHVLYYEDPFGNQHHNGTMEIATTYMLLEDGQEICYADTGLPADFSRNYTGPERGAFKAAALSASASTMFVINEAGEMYTRLADFDTTGCDPMWFKYTYQYYQSDLPGDNYFSNLNEWGLPAEDWRPQPRIPLAGKAAVTRHITILQNGRGNGARELRAAGLNEAGEPGYWTKAIFGGEWRFQTAPLLLGEGAFLKDTAPDSNDVRGERGLSPDKYYRGYSWAAGGEREADWQYEIPNFNILEGDCDFRVSWRGESCVLKLYLVEMWTYLKRDYLPGRTGSPKVFFATLAVPENALDGLSESFILRITEKFVRNDKALFQYTIAASNRYILMRETGDTESLWFLTDETLSNNYAEFQFSRHVENYAELRRYYAPELIIKPETPVMPETLTEKTAANKHFLDELKYKIRTLKWSQLTVFKFNFGYIPAHYLARITPLRFIDVPKIRTVTSFGEKIILANSAYINTVSNTRIWVYEKLIELLEARLRCYSDIAKNGSTAPSVLPFWYSDSISAYWDIAGLPHTVPGVFFGPHSGISSPQVPAVMSFSPSQPEQGVTGWNLTVGGGDTFIFIDPRSSPKTIYARGGKTPEEQKLQLDCTLYFNKEAKSSLEQDIIKRCLEPFVAGENQGVDVRISFDGSTFEIREHPVKHSSTIMFRGTR